MHAEQQQQNKQRLTALNDNRQQG